MTRTWKLVASALALSGAVAACDELREPTGPEGHAIAIEEEALHLLPGDERQLGVERGAGVLSWEIHDRAVISVSADGLVTALAPGMTWAVARSGTASDSVRVSVSFPAAQSGAIAFTFGSAEDPLHLSGVSRIYQPMWEAGSWTQVTAAVGLSNSAELRLEDFFADQDTLVILRIKGVAEAGYRKIEPWKVVDRGEGQFGIEGAEGALVWIRDPSDRTRTHIYVPVGEMSLEIDRSELPAEIGPPTGKVVGRMGFEAAGLVVVVDENGTRIVGQVSTETTRFFAEFDLPQRIHPFGRIRTQVAGGPLPLEISSAYGPEAGIWEGGLLVNTGLLAQDSRAYHSQIWYGSPAAGEVRLDPVRIEEIMDRSALGGGRAWVWTESGTIEAMEAEGSFTNLGLSESGTLRISRYDPPGQETWGVLEGTLEVEEKLFFGGEAGAKQTVTMEILAPVEPTSHVVYPHQPSRVVNRDDVDLGAGSIRVGNGPLELPGRVVETSVNPVRDMAITLRWEGGSATVRTNDQGDFRFTGVAAGLYEIHFEVPQGYGLAWRQPASPLGPVTVSAEWQTWIPIHLADAQGNAALRIAAGSSGINTTVDGVEARVRLAGSSTVVKTLVTGDFHAGMSWSKLPPGKYEVDFTVPAGYKLLDGQLATVALELFKGREAFVHVGVVRQ